MFNFQDTGTSNIIAIHNITRYITFMVTLLFSHITFNVQTVLKILEYQLKLMFRENFDEDPPPAPLKPMLLSCNRQEAAREEDPDERGETSYKQRATGESS